MVERKKFKKEKGEQKIPEDEIDISIDLGGISGVFKGVANFIELVERMHKEGKTNFTRQGEIKGLGDKGLKGVFGVSVKFGLGGTPEVEPFGNIRPSSQGPVVEETREPITDVFTEDTQVLVVAELPGVEEKEITAELKDDIIVINAASKAVPGRKYAKEVLLEVPVRPETLTKSFKNGILEVKLQRQEESSQ